jgi:tight adherence protein B
VGTGPGAFGGGWVLPVGIVVAGAALLIVIGMALVPAEGRASQLHRVRERFKPSGGLLSRVSSGIQSALDRALERPGRRGLTAALDSAGVRWSAGEFVIVTLAAVLVSIAAGLALFGLIGMLVFGLVALAGPFLVLSHRREKRRSGFEEQMEGALQLMSGSLRAGYGLLQAINTVAAEAPDPIRDEFARVMIEIRVGRDLGEALAAMAERMKNEDFRWVAQAIEIQRTVGGDLSEILDTVAGTIRERNQIRRQVKALSAEGRISAYVLIALPFVIATFLVLVAPDFLTPLFDTAAGRIALGVAIGLLLIGIVWIRKMVNIKF